jgi:hypothetical protein
MLITKIRQNDPALKKLSLVESPNKYFTKVTDLVDALKSNSVINVIRLGGEFLLDLETEERNALLKQAGRLSSLREIQLSGCSPDVGALAEFMEQAKKLEVLDLGHVTLQGSSDEFTDFEYSIFKHQSLKKFILTNFQAGEAEQKIGGIIKALCNVSTLEVLKLEGSNATEFTFPNIALLPLCKSPTLQELHVSHFHVEELLLA